MAKIKITALTDKMDDEDILAKLKKIGVKVKDKVKEDVPREEAKDHETPASEQMVEKRVASTIIRRRVQPPKVKEEPAEEKPEPKKPGKEEAKAEPKAEPKAAPKKKQEEPAKAEKKKEAQKAAEKRAKQEPLVLLTEEHPAGPEQIPETQVEAEPQAPQSEGLKGDLEVIGQEKGKEITKVLEEAYKQDLEKDFTLAEGGTEEERQRRKTEKLLKKIEEQEIEETKVKKKGVLKRKVVIKEEDLYTFRRQKPRGAQFKRGKKEKVSERRAEEEKKAEVKIARKVVKVSDEIQVGELAKRMGVKAQEIIAKLFPLGVIATVNQAIDYDTAYLAATEMGYDVEKIVSIEEAFLAREEEDKEGAENLQPRSPVVTIMGHVDHGKTLLLDTIRHTNVAEREAGGITQHIGAYKVDVGGKEIVFVDTPGHEAFTAMRARGALVTDIIILVVAADDGVMPQTIEAINHAKSAQVPIIVAVNKIDKQNANVDKVMKELSELSLVPEEWGGTTLFAKISAKKKTGIQELLELIILQAEMLELKANPDKLARATIIESELDKGHGPVGTVIIQEGTLKIQDPFISGMTFGRVRAMLDDKGKRIQSAPPSAPVLVVGFQDVPHGGDRFIVTTEERYARELSKFRQEKLREKEAAKSSRTTLEELYSKIGEAEKVVLNVIVKGDVRGTIDAIVESLKKLSNDIVEVQITHSGVGAITETDINLAMASGSIVIGFNVKPVAKAQALAEQENIEIRTYTIIYNMIDDIKKAMEGMLAPKIVQVGIGKAEIRKVFSVSRIGSIGGCYVTEGKVTRNAIVKLMRASETIFTGKLASLKRFKDDAKEVLSGYECGMSLDGFNDIKEGDVLEFYVEEQERQTLDG
ncbi:MAG TPA: translation initiation factor IF-2 [Syntrophorhabdaceae bacterium]|nr:translation initiation factor IF-2 [Syntrophorhabdaceae bacterium]HNT68959.1 translation initiation factor IF-2 [Syntrophorhabdaceae bacterium]